MLKFRAMLVITLPTHRAAAKPELLFNEPISVLLENNRLGFKGLLIVTPL